MLQNLGAALRKKMSGDNETSTDALVKQIHRQVQDQNKIFDERGQLDARAFKQLVYAKEAGTVTGSKTFMAGATAQAGGYL